MLSTLKNVSVIDHNFKVVCLRCFKILVRCDKKITRFFHDIFFFKVKLRKSWTRLVKSHNQKTNGEKTQKEMKITTKISTNATNLFFKVPSVFVSEKCFN